MTRDPSTRDQWIAILCIAIAVILAGMFLVTRSRIDEQQRRERFDSLGYQIAPDSVPETWKGVPDAD